MQQRTSHRPLPRPSLARGELIERKPPALVPFSRNLQLTPSSGRLASRCFHPRLLKEIVLWAKVYRYYNWKVLQ